ncbi:hypothetical protein IBX73_09630, partial [candidate division WOR-3 bacterium]|nr:hypothetical protein [candidate division WOR-3 bacterium]
MPDIVPPSPPTNLVATYDSIYQVVALSWDAVPEPDIGLYRIYRSGMSGSYSTPLDSVLEPITTFIDSTILFDTTYYYVVTAVDTCDNESEYSNEAVVVIPDTTPPSAPTNLAATYDSMSQSISLSWTAPSDPDIKLYRLYRSEISGYYGMPLDSVTAATTTAVDSAIMLGKTYYYVVTALDSSNNESGYSNEDTVNVPVKFMSFSALASAFNNGRRMVRNPATGELFLSYTVSDAAAC